MTIKPYIDVSTYLSGTDTADGTKDLSYVFGYDYYNTTTHTMTHVSGAFDDLAEGGHLYIPPGIWSVRFPLIFQRRMATITCLGQIQAGLTSGDGHTTEDPQVTSPGDYDFIGDYVLKFPCRGANIVDKNVDYQLGNIGNRLHINRLVVDCRCVARGIWFENLYLSTLTAVEVYRSYGTAIHLDKSSENVWLHTKSALCARRPASWLNPSDGHYKSFWTPAATYSRGEVVLREFVGWSSTTTYDTSSLVTYDITNIDPTKHKYYRSKIAGNLNYRPDLNAAYWVEVEPQYFMRTSHNPTGPNYDPFALSTTPGIAGAPYTTNSGYANRYWLPVLDEEPLWDINNTGNSALPGNDLGINIRTGQIQSTDSTTDTDAGDNKTTIDNQYFYGADIRDCEHKTFVNIDNSWGNQSVLKVAFIGGQIHTINTRDNSTNPIVITYGSTDCYLAVAGSSPTKPQPQSEGTANRHVLVRAAFNQYLKMVGVNVRPADVAASIAISIGAETPSKDSATTSLLFVDVHGGKYGDNQVGLYVSSNADTSVAEYINPNFILPGTGAVDYVDGRGVVRMDTTTPLHAINGVDALAPIKAISGNPSTPGFAFTAYPATGIDAGMHKLSLIVDGKEALTTYGSGRSRIGVPMKTPDVFKREYVLNSGWTSSTTAPAAINWHSICWSPKNRLFVAVAYSEDGSGSRIATSPDGLVWTARTTPAAYQWLGVCWSPEQNLFVAVANTGSGNRVMTSSDGISWAQPGGTVPADTWTSVCWSSDLGLFCAVATSGANNSVMTSPDGLTWTRRTGIPVGASAVTWRSVCWSPELHLFCAVGDSGTTGGSGTAFRVMTSSDGLNWTTPASTVPTNGWVSVCWSPELGLFCAVASAGSGGNYVMTSLDGSTWTQPSGTITANAWQNICWSPELGLFTAVSSTGTGNRVMTSPDGIHWTTHSSAVDNPWTAICWSPDLGVFSAIASVSGTNRAMKTTSMYAFPYA